MGLIDKIKAELKHPVVKLLVGKAVEKGLKRVVQGAVSALGGIVLTGQVLAGQPDLDPVQVNLVLTALVFGALEAVRTTLKAKVPALSTLL